MLRLHRGLGIQLLGGSVVKWLRGAIVVLLLGSLCIGLLLTDLERHISSLVEWTRGTGVVGVLGFAAAYVGATMLLLPGSVLTLAAGFAYGPSWGLLVVSPVSVVAATAAFLVGRFALRRWVERRFADHPRLDAIDRAIEHGGFKIVFLLRLSPVIPFNVLNYALALTRVRPRDYVLASFLGMLPGTLLYVYLGSLVSNASELFSQRPVSTLEQAFYFGGLLATIAVTWYVTRLAQRRLRHALGESSTTQDSKRDRVADEGARSTS